MNKTFAIIDERGNWHEAALAAAAKAGFEGKRYTRGADVPVGTALGFMRPHAEPQALLRNQREDWPSMDQRCKAVVQDTAQVNLYEDKTNQARSFAEFMPRTWRFETHSKALEFIESEDCPRALVSKADVGASSVNVQVLKTPNALRAHLSLIFDKGGWKVQHCDSQGTWSLQKDHVLLQEFIPHQVTWRINRIGNVYCGFQRYNYPGQCVAQTGNVKPMLATWDSEIGADLLRFAQRVTDAINTRWCALDILMHEGTPKLLETSLAWPWPSPGDCDESPFVGDKCYYTGRLWRNMFSVMFEQYEEGAFNASNRL